MIHKRHKIMTQNDLKNSGQLENDHRLMGNDRVFLRTGMCDDFKQVQNKHKVMVLLSLWGPHLWGLSGFFFTSVPVIPWSAYLWLSTNVFMLTTFSF